MKGLYRDCNITPDYGDNTCIDGPLLCQYITKNDVEGKSKEELDDISLFQYITASLNYYLEVITEVFMVEHQKSYCMLFCWACVII